MFMRWRYKLCFFIQTGLWRKSNKKSREGSFLQAQKMLSCSLAVNTWGFFFPSLHKGCFSPNTRQLFKAALVLYAPVLLLLLYTGDGCLCCLSLICSLIFAYFPLWLILCYSVIKIIYLNFAFWCTKTDGFVTLLCSITTFPIVWWIILWIFA